MRYPSFLKSNGTIGLIAPSFGLAGDPYLSLFQNTRQVFTSRGYTLVYGPNCFVSRGIGKSNTPEACAAEINDFFINKKADVILSCGGGETMCEDLAYVDFEGIAQAEPLWYMGFSDNTNLTFTLPVLCDTAAIYGPCASHFGVLPWHDSVRDAFDLLTGRRDSFTGYGRWELTSLRDADHPFAPMNLTEDLNLKLYIGKDSAEQVSVTGRMIGGCLDVLQVLCGTPYDKTAAFAERYKEDGILWFLEACDLNPMSVRRALWQLDQAGWFDHASGFLIGRSAHFGESTMGLTMYEAYLDILGKYSVPLVMDADLGHLPPMMPLVSGAVGELSASVPSQKPSFWELHTIFR